MRLKWVLCFCIVLAVSTGHLSFGQQPTPISSSNPAPAQGSQTDDEKTIKFWVGSFSDYEIAGHHGRLRKLSAAGIYSD